ncbi:DUF2690 domain-containing protein [Paractinoplanes toevensis]|uniref:DUF2690 domain-containing protein n=1 Tax=Paractinoplanes toevensis TaxID=571911 RepID=A0A919WBV8_9ACTN|nr:DUF2690 domain-containing protein [Actinoplanes toevensis]GIM97323.1 hypothetical protein Ato02nite_091160 [Actinoplanes toevensis]
MSKKIVAAAIIGAITALIGPVPAFAATSGCGNTCDGKDPDNYYATVDGKVMRCSFIDVKTLDEQHGVQLRYSPFCRTAWARAVTPGNWSYIVVESYTAAGTLRKRYRAGQGDAWSVMVNDKNLYARACHYSYDGEDEAAAGGVGHFDGCTGKY